MNELRCKYVLPYQDYSKIVQNICLVLFTSFVKIQLIHHRHVCVWFLVHNILHFKISAAFEISV